MYQFEPEGVCPAAIRFDLQDGKVRNVQFDGGCNGNLKAIGQLVEGMEANACIEKLKGIRCGMKSTSCGDQLAKAIDLALKQPA
jgi:uncharacterized protein (TIGR03905 family)